MDKMSASQEDFSSVGSISWNQSQFSYSVNKLLGELASFAEGSDLLQLSKQLYRQHPEYSNGRTVKTRSKTINSNITQAASSPYKVFLDFLEQQETKISVPKFPVKAWVEKVLEIVQAYDNSAIIHGRLFLAGALLFQFEPISDLLSGAERKQWLQDSSVLIDALIKELDGHPDYKVVLTSFGQSQFQKLKDLAIGINDSIEDQEFIDQSIVHTHNLSDYPSEEDSLSRKALAAYLAKRIRHIYKRDIANSKLKLGSFFVHIDGAWGSGKSTLLRFLEQELSGEDPNQPKQNQTKDKWVVVNFNAWENQRLNSPWWSLMKTIYSKSRKEFRRIERRKWRKIWFQEYWWRLNTGTNYLWVGLATFLFFILALVFKVKTPDELNKFFPFAPLITLVGFLWSIIRLWGSSLASGSAKAAQSFIEENGKDPMNILAQHFQKQIEFIGYPVAIFIDDLDRCNKDYGIKLLEGLQTIFRKAPVVYVVAADRKWLSTMYEEEYKMFATVIAKPSKPFGLVFLDKTFQLVVELPVISALQKKIYWDKLLNSPNNDQKLSNKERNEIKEEVQNTTTNEEKIKIAQQAAGSMEKQQAIREEVISNVSIREEEDLLQHKLSDFVGLIEPNPRSMKRLINDVSTANALTILYNQDVKLEQLILWIILKQEHPALAEFFWENPEKINQVWKELPDQSIFDQVEYEALLKKPAVKNLFQYKLKKKTVKLDARFLKSMKFE